MNIKKIFKLLSLTLIITCTFTAGDLILKKKIAKADTLSKPQINSKLSQDEILKKDIIKFSHTPSDKILINKDIDLKNSKQYELYDDNYFYHVKYDGTLCGIVSRTARPKTTATNDLTDTDKAFLKNKAEEMLKKFGKQGYVLNEITNNLSINGLYIMNFAEKNKDGVCTGNECTISLSSEGEVVLAALTTGDSSIASKPVKITKKQAKNIFLKDLNNDNPVLKYHFDMNTLTEGKDLLSLSKNQYVLQRDVYKGKAVWVASLSFKDSGQIFDYIVDASSGAIIDKPILKEVIIPMKKVIVNGKEVWTRAGKLIENPVTHTK